MTSYYEQKQRTDDGLMKAEPSPWTEPFQHTCDQNTTDRTAAAVQTDAAASHAASHAAKPATKQEAPMQANQHMDDQTRNALSKIYYGH